jgi:ABC-2 type transport system ATP-binding protein
VGIRAERLKKTFGSLTAVDELSFDVDDGEVFGLLGPNGAGKTTTIRMLACLISPTYGSASVSGFSVTKEPTKVRERVGIVTENPSLYERLTAYENLQFFAEAYGMEKERSEPRIAELLKQFDLFERRSDFVAHFSKGMKQKLAITRALVHSPTVLLLDEPTAGLDPESAKEVRDMITELSKRERCSILLSTHRLQDAENICHRVTVVDKGRSIASGSPEQLRKEMSGPPTLEIVLKNETSNAAESVRHLSTVKSLTTDATILLISIDDPDAATPEIVERVVQAGGQILSVNVLRESFEAAYLKLIHREANPQ